jgi:hypothetical protein
MSPYECYKQYLAFKRHFSTKSYDYIKYHGQVKVSMDSFNKRRDKYFYEKMSRKKSDDEVKDYFLSNFVSSDNPSNLWIGEIINNGETIYTEWTKRQQSLSYLFKEQSSELLSSNKLPDVFNCSRGHPILLKRFLGGALAIEILVIYDIIFGYSANFDKKLQDPVWETVGLKISKYKPFLNINVFNYKKLLKNIIDE